MWREAGTTRLYDAFLVPLVAHRVAGDVRPPEAVVDRLQDYVYLNLRMPFEAPVLTTRNRDVLLRGFAYCDQAVYVFVHLLQEREISGRMTYLYRPDGVSPHTVAEVQLDGDWQVRDVLYDFDPTRPDGAGASVKDLVEQPRLLAKSRVPVEWYQHAKVRMVRGPERRRQGGPAWPFVRQAAVRRMVAFTPRWVADRLQDLYLRLPALPQEDPRFATDPGRRALLPRPPSPRAPAGRQGRGRVSRSSCDAIRRIRRPITCSTTSGCSSSVSCRTRRLRSGRSSSCSNAYPETVWGNEATYLLARAHAAANHCAAAAALYRRVIDADGGGREDATERLRHLACA